MSSYAAVVSTSGNSSSSLMSRAMATAWRKAGVGRRSPLRTRVICAELYPVRSESQVPLRPCASITSSNFVPTGPPLSETVQRLTDLEDDTPFGKACQYPLL